MPESDARRSEKQLSFSKKVWIAGGIFSLIIILLLLFKTIFSVLLLSLAGILIAVFFHGCANILHRNFHWNKKLCLIISVIVNMLIVVAFFWFVGARLQQQVSELSETLPTTISNVKDRLDNSAIGSKVLNYLNESGNSEKTRAVVKDFFSSSFGILSDLYIVILLALFFTASPSLYKRGIIHLMPPQAKDKADNLLDKLKMVLEKWLKGQIIGFFFIAIFTGIGLWIIGMPLILTLALTAGLLNFIPNFGPIIALVPAGLLALMQGPTTAIIVVCMYTFIQIIQSAVTQPLIQQKMVNIPPALTIISQVAFGLIAGFWGVLLATPMIAILMTVVNELYVKEQLHHKYELEGE